MAAVLKIARRRELPRGFESHTLRSVISRDIEDTPKPPRWLSSATGASAPVVTRGDRCSYVSARLRLDLYSVTTHRRCSCSIHNGYSAVMASHTQAGGRWAIRLATPWRRTETSVPDSVRCLRRCPSADNILTCDVQARVDDAALKGRLVTGRIALRGIPACRVQV